MSKSLKFVMILLFSAMPLSSMVYASDNTATSNILNSGDELQISLPELVVSPLRLEDIDLELPALIFDKSPQLPVSCDETILDALSSRTNYFHEGANDAEIARQREGLYIQLKHIFAGNPLEEKSDDGDGLRQIKILLQKNEFSSWLRTYDEVSKNLNTPINDRDALIKPLPDPQESFLSKLGAIRNAKYTVDTAMYIFGSDEAAYAYLNELKEALRRGVNIRILEDSIGSFSNSLAGNPQFKSLIDFARDNAGFVKDPTTGEPTNIRATAEVVVFNPVSNVLALFRNIVTKIANFIRRLFLGPEYRPWAETNWNPFRRMHDKILLVDAEFPELAVAITGGRNIQNVYHNLYHMDPITGVDLDPETVRQFEDFEVMIRNSPEAIKSKDPERSIGKILTQEFDRLYFHKANRRITEGLIGLLFGRKKYFKNMEDAEAIVNVETAQTQDRINEHITSPDFGKHILACGFFDQTVDFANTAYNLTRPFGLSEAVHDALTVPKGPIDITKYQEPDNPQSILARISKYLFAEDEEITFISPYIWLSPRDIQAIYYWLRLKPSHHITVITSSVLTNDNSFSLALTEVAVIPMLLSDESLRPQITVYEYGKCDDKALGGDKVYNRMHTKAVYFQSQKITLATSFNKDPLSEFSNSELGTFITGEEMAKDTEAKIRDLKLNSVVWGTDEYACIREKAKLNPQISHRVTMQKALFWMLDKLGLWKFM